MSLHNATVIANTNEIGHVQYINILAWLGGYRVKCVNVSSVSQFSKETWKQRKQKASKPCWNIERYLLHCLE